MNIFLYLDKKTFIHSLDPRSKIIGAIILTSACLCFNHPFYMALISFGIIFIGILAKATLNFKRLRFILLLLFIFSTLIWPFFIEGKTTWLKLGSLILSKESILYGLTMGIRLSTFVIIGLILLSTTRNEELTNGLIRIGLPYPVAFAISTALRLIPTFAGAGATIVQAQISRGLDLESGNIFHRISKFIPQAVPLFIYAIRYTNLLAIALESKGFSPESKRTLYYQPQMRLIDYIIIVLLSLLLIFLIYLRLVRGIGVIIHSRI